MKHLTVLLCLLSLCASAQKTNPEATEVWEPVPNKVTPGLCNTNAPSDAIVLFDADDLNEWLTRADGGVAHWTVTNDSFMVKPGAGDIISRRVFGDIQLHIEWRAPLLVSGEGQGRGNSGVFLQERYEIQVLDSYASRTYSNGQAGSVYKQSPPLVNAMRPHDEWQTYDIIYRAPLFNTNDVKTQSAYVTVLHNGVLIQNHTEILGTTEYIGPPVNKAHGDGAIILQDHGNTVSFRNIWVREL